MTRTELRLYQAWFRHYVLGGSRLVGETLADAIDEGVNVNEVLDRATIDSASMRERAYRRQGRASIAAKGRRYP